MANWRKTRYAGIYVAHSKSCPAYADAGARCRCKPSWRGRAWDSAGRRAVWSRSSKHRSEALAWLVAVSKGADHLAELAKLGPTFESLGEQWLDGVERGHIGRRRGRGKAYSDTTIEGMLRSWKYRLKPEFGARIAEEITEIDWQRWIDALARSGLSRSTIAKHVSVASGIYAWASAPSRRLVPRNPAAPRRTAPERREAATARRARTRTCRSPRRARAGRSPPLRDRLLAGLRRSEIYRLDWEDVLEDGRIPPRLIVRRSKSEAGTSRRPPIADNLRTVLTAA